MRKIFAAFLLAVLCAASANAATTTNSVITAQTPNNGKLAIGLTASCTASATPYTCCTGNGTGCTLGTYYTVYMAGSNGSRCNALWMTSNDATSHNVTCQVVNTLKYGGETVATGTNTPGFASAAPAINMLSATNWPGLPVDIAGNPYLQMISGDTLACTWATAITSSDVINLVASCQDF